MNHTCLNPQLQSIAALWLVLISCPTEDRRLSWPGWLSEILRWFSYAKTVAHSSICRGGQELNLRPSSCESNALTTRLLFMAALWNSAGHYVFAL